MLNIYTKNYKERSVRARRRSTGTKWPYSMGSSMIACKDADAMVTGNIRHYAASIEKLKKVTEPRPGEEIFGMTMITLKEKLYLLLILMFKIFHPQND